MNCEPKHNKFYFNLYKQYLTFVWQFFVILLFHLLIRQAQEAIYIVVKIHFNAAANNYFELICQIIFSRLIE